MEASDRQQLMAKITSELHLKRDGSNTEGLQEFLEVSPKNSLNKSLYILRVPNPGYLNTRVSFAEKPTAWTCAICFQLSRCSASLGSRQKVPFEVENGASD